MIDQLFNVETSDRYQEELIGLGGAGLIPAFDGTVRYDEVNAGYRKDIRHFEFAGGIQIERSLWDDGNRTVIRQRATNLGMRVANTIETDAANIFVNAFTDAGTNRMGDTTNGGDAVGLCSTAHPDSPRNSGTTQSNEGTLALDLPNLDTTRQAMLNFTDDRGNLLGVNPDTLLIPPELERTATQILSERALYEPGSAQFDVNMFAGRIRPIVWNRLTDANAWFLIDSRQMKMHLHWFWRIPPELANVTDFDSLLAKYRVYMRYGNGFDDWRWIYGQNPS
jgi:phage major head subunit gpT-like protein